MEENKTNIYSFVHSRRRGKKWNETVVKLSFLIRHSIVNCCMHKQWVVVVWLFRILPPSIGVSNAFMLVLFVCVVFSQFFNQWRECVCVCDYAFRFESIAFCYICACNCYLYVNLMPILLPPCVLLLLFCGIDSMHIIRIT